MTENPTKFLSKPGLVLKNPALPLIISLGIMIIFDQVTWERQFGLQFLVLVLLVLTGLLIMAFLEKRHAPWTSYLLLVPILLGAVMTAVYSAGITTFFNVIQALASLVLLALTLLNGQWLGYRIREVLLGTLLLVQSVITEPVRVLIERAKSNLTQPASEKNAAWRRVRPYLLGVLLALPLLLILGALLASADMIFRQSLESFFNWFRIDNLFDVIFRAAYILIFGCALAGAFMHALTYSAEKKTLSPDKPFLKPFLGHVEAFTVLSLVNLLFLGFIVVQFRYFFAGEANISFDGFTYAEYARRGFFELVAVAIISLGLHYLLSMFTKRPNPAQKRFFSALGLLLLLQVGTMLVSAFQRLSLYEAAYGFTTLRTITHVFMIWLGVMLAAAALMEIFNQFKRLALVLFLVLFGFTLTLNLLNVDGFIAQRNIAHAAAGHPLDAAYLLWNLGEDGIPVLFEQAQSAQTPEGVKATLEAVLACRYARRSQEAERDHWAEWHLSATRAEALFAANKSELESYPFITRTETHEEYNEGVEANPTFIISAISVNGEELWCTSTELN